MIFLSPWIALNIIIFTLEVRLTRPLADWFPLWCYQVTLPLQRENDMEQRYPSNQFIGPCVKQVCLNRMRKRQRFGRAAAPLMVQTNCSFGLICPFRIKCLEIKMSLPWGGLGMWEGVGGQVRWLSDSSALCRHLIVSLGPICIPVPKVTQQMVRRAVLQVDRRKCWNGSVDISQPV